MNKLTQISYVAAIALMAACGGVAPYAAIPIENDAEMVTNIVVTDPDLREVIRVGRPGVQRIEVSNQLKVMVPIRNIGDVGVQVRVQVSFLNLDKQPIGDDTNQQFQIISPGMTVNHTVTSMKSEARDWVMRIIPNN
jgi:hypothetical protein